MVKRINKWRKYSRYEIRCVLFKTLRRFKHGATAKELSELLNMTRKIISEELNRLWSEDKLGIHKVGNAKLFLRRQYFR